MIDNGIPASIREAAREHGAAAYVQPSGRPLLIIWHANSWRIFANHCPHRRLPLDRAGHVHLSQDGLHVICVNHGARFDRATGDCVAGPCMGKSLQWLFDLED